jgi:hypothetical protein
MKRGCSGMQTCSRKEHKEGEEGIGVFVEEQNDPVLLGFFLLIFNLTMAF